MTVVAFKSPAPGPSAAPKPIAPVIEVEPIDHRHSVWRPVVLGCTVIAIFVVGLLGWAAVFKISGGVVSTGFFKVEDNRKIVKHRDGGIVREILVREGDPVKEGQVLMRLSDIQPRAQMSVLQSQYDSYLAQRARFEAEQDGAKSVAFPEELASRRSEEMAAHAMADQDRLFRARLSLYEAQVNVLNQRIDQLNTRIGGLRSQLEAAMRQSELIDEELVGITHLAEQGLVPKTRQLALQRTAAELAGQKGALIAEITRVEQTIGETQLQLAQLKEQRATESAEGIRDMQTRISDVLPRLRATRETLGLTEITAPVDGYVLNLTQFTVGGVVGAGERLLDVVPTGTPLVIEARVRPEDIDEVGAGQKALVQVNAYRARELAPLEAQVVKVAADRTYDERSGESYFNVEARIPQSELEKLPELVRITPGMPAQVMIATGERTILDYIMTPITSSMGRALREN